MILELILLGSLGINGWQFFDRGELSHSNKQLTETVKNQDELIKTHVTEIKDHEENTRKANEVRQGIERRYADQSVQLEKLKVRDSSSRDFLDSELPSGIIELLQADNQN